MLLFFINCASHTYQINNYKVPVSFANEEGSSKNSRYFRIEKKLTWLIFDLVKIQEFDLTHVLESELPNAKKIYNFRIESEENAIDSVIRIFGTGMQYLFASNRSIVSRRTVIISGTVSE